MRRLAPVVVTLVALAVIAAATLRGGDPRDSRTAWCLVCPPRGSRVGVDVVLNVLLFIPYGFGLGAMGLSRLRTTLLVLLTTLLVELLQLYVVPGRHSSAADVITNTLGGFLGMSLARQGRTLIDPALSRARTLTLVGIGVWLALIAGSGLASTPSLANSAYSVRWRPAGSNERGAGRVLAAQVGGIPLAPGSGAADDPRLDALRRGEPTELAMKFLPAAEGGGDARVEVRAAGRPARVVLGQDGADVLLRVHLRASDVRLRGPTLRIADALDPVRHASKPDTVTLQAQVSRSALRLQFAHGERRGVRELELGPHLGWSFLLPGRMGLPAGIRAVADAFWLAFVLLPVGYWAGRSMRNVDRTERPSHVAVGLAAIALLLLGLWGIPAAVGVTRAPAMAWGMAAACLLVGWSVGKREHARAGQHRMLR